MDVSISRACMSSGMVDTSWAAERAFPPSGAEGKAEGKRAIRLPWELASCTGLLRTYFPPWPLTTINAAGRHRGRGGD